MSDPTKKDLSERDICTKYITPALTDAKWDLMAQIREEVSFTKGRVIVRGQLSTRGEPKRADYILSYKPGIPLAVIEAKDNNHCGVEAGRYISLERIIEDNKERYYEVLEQSSTRWHESKHDPWPAMNFLLFILTHACKEFEQRVGQLKSPRGEKTALVENAIARQIGLFSLSDLQSASPGVSVDLIRSVLKRLKGDSIECLGRGHTAKWRKTAK